MTVSHSVTQTVAVKKLDRSQLQTEVSHMETKQKQKKKKCALLHDSAGFNHCFAIINNNNILVETLFTNNCGCLSPGQNQP